ncbi:hypothetical protein EPUS_03409 [Endocarpon pusillum Z07020]|uniref:F5/8 type C domain-containing protein n=1 Tax=Endocarpon pusillum (strain Z07020 / HMAS-L-300199) TaxID=1263415 RepID=U1HXP5_ENDPU|nr:uncharacterized protein EPUS_03409 [Endocarpon pusillum Z07020]ERF74219.1 hypothetical protein EPUS_03409 [Endocarpon pusillum Z07020]
MLRNSALSISFAFTFLRRQGISIIAASQDRVPVPQYDLPQEVLKAGEGQIKPVIDTTGKQKPDRLPHTITIDLRIVEKVNAVSTTPRFDVNRGGAITAHKGYFSLDNQTWGDPVAFGTWFEDGQGQILVIAKMARE